VIRATTAHGEAVGRESPGDIDWSLTTWEGSRREQLRQWAKLTLEEIVQAQEEMAELSARQARNPDGKP